MSQLTELTSSKELMPTSEEHSQFASSKEPMTFFFFFMASLVQAPAWDGDAQEHRVKESWGVPI